MTSGLATVLGLSLFFVEAGTGPVILYVHGNTGSSFWYSRVMEIPGYRTIALDLPNFGRSGRLPPGSAIDDSDLDLYAEYLGVFIRSLDPEGKGPAPVLVAHSLGGAVAMSLAVRHPGLVRALVLVDSSSPTGLQTPEERFPMIEYMRTNPAVLKAALGAVVPTVKDPEFLDRGVEEALLMNPLSFIGNARALTRFDCSALCPEYKGPVLVLRGARDVIITEDMARQTAAAFPQGELQLLDEVGHSPMAEDPEGFIRIISNFAQRVLQLP